MFLTKYNELLEGHFSTSLQTLYEFQLIKRYNNQRKALNYNSGYLFEIHKAFVKKLENDPPRVETPD